MTARGFTLVEMMVASVIAIILVNAGAQFAAAMATNVKRAEEQGDLGARQSIAHAFIGDLLSGAAYNWNTPRAVGSNDSGSFGEGGCALSSGFCTASGEIKPPLQICDSVTVDRNVCNAPTATTADALWTYVPRDNIIEAVSILDRNGTALTNNCDAANVPASTTFDVRGVTSVGWAVDDIVLVSRRGHTTVGTVRAAFGTDANPNNTRQLTIDVGTGATLAFDDGTEDVCPDPVILQIDTNADINVGKVCGCGILIFTDNSLKFNNDATFLWRGLVIWDMKTAGKELRISGNGTATFVIEGAALLAGTEGMQFHITKSVGGGSNILNTAGQETVKQSFHLNDLAIQDAFNAVKAPIRSIRRLR